MSDISKGTQSLYRRLAHSRWFPMLFFCTIFAAIVCVTADVGQKHRSPQLPPPTVKIWVPFSWPDLGVEVVMPEAPKIRHIRIPALGTTLKVVAYNSSSDRTTYSIGYTDYPSDMPLPSTPEELMAKASEWLGVHAINSDATVENIRYRGHDGIEASRIARTGDGRRVRSLSRWFLSGRRGVVIGATGDDDQFDDAGAQRFMDSLRFTGIAADGSEVAPRGGDSPGRE